MVAFDGGGVAVGPRAGEVEIVSALAPDMTLANMFLSWSNQQGKQVGIEATHVETLGGITAFLTASPLTRKAISHRRYRHSSSSSGSGSSGGDSFRCRDRKCLRCGRGLSGM